MPDGLAGLPGDPGTSAPAPALSSADIERVKAELQADFDKRIAGFQAKVVAPRDAQLAQLRSELEAFKTAGLSPEELEQRELETMRQENARLQSALDLKNLSATYGDEVPFFERLLAASSAEEQLGVMREYRTALAVPSTQAAAAPAAPAAAEPVVPEIDLNRPMREVYSGQLLADGTRMTEELADRLLGSVSRQADVTQRRIRPSD